MADVRALVRVVDELLWSLRREGFVVSTAQAVDVARVVREVGLEKRDDVHAAVGAVVVQRATERARYDAAFDAFFGAAAPDRRTLWDRLASPPWGFAEEELDALRELLGQLATSQGDAMAPLGLLLERGAELDRVLALASVAQSLDAHSGMQLGFLTHRLLGQMGAGRARQGLGALRTRLVDALGPRGEALADALAKELEAAEDEVRAHVRRTYEARVAEVERQRAEHRIEMTPFAALSDSEIEEVRRAVRRFAERLRGGARVRARRALRGRIDPHRTLRRALRTGGVPFDPARKERHRDRPKLVLLCDVSDSVRAAAAFLLEFTYAAQDLFARARSFVFVSELGETTNLFDREPVRQAIARAWGGGVIRSGDNSNYGRVLRELETRHGREIDRRTTVVILGDGRTNYLDPAAEVLDRIRERSRALLWLCPEPRGQWSQGDSAMAQYAPKCTAVYEVRCAADLERAARVLVSR
ncbi:MAG TPA: VWA domain-containing protein [Polyangiaceae bacterium]